LRTRGPFGVSGRPPAAKFFCQVKAVKLFLESQRDGGLHFLAGDGPVSRPAPLQPLRAPVAELQVGGRYLDLAGVPVRTGRASQQEDSGQTVRVVWRLVPVQRLVRAPQCLYPDRGRSAPDAAAPPPT